MDCVCRGSGGTGSTFQNGGGRGSAFVGKAGGWGGSGTFILGLLTHDGSDNALGTPRWVVQQKGWTGTGSGAVNNKNWTPGSKDVPVILGAIWDGTATTATLNGSTFQNSGAAHTINNQNSGFRIGAVSSYVGNSKISEVLIFDTALTTENRQKIEGYLAHKWSLAGNLPETHSYKSSIPILGNSPFSSDISSGTGQSLDLSNGTFATVSTGSTEDVFDGDNNFSVSMWLKGWPAETSQSLLSKKDFDPGSMGSLMTWLDASEAKYLTITEGTFSSPSNGNDIARWLDKSGKGHDGIPNTSGTTPTWQSSSLNSKPYSFFFGYKQQHEKSRTVKPSSMAGVNFMYLRLFRSMEM